jgi:hypothetical protein
LTLKPNFIEPADVMENLAKANAARWKKIEDMLQWAIDCNEVL